MSFYSEPFDAESSRGDELLRLLKGSPQTRVQVQDFVAAARVLSDGTEINWEQSLDKSWREILHYVFEHHTARQLISSAIKQDTYTAQADRLRELLEISDAEASSEELIASFIRQRENSRWVFGEPFLDRDKLRRKVARLFADDRRVLIITGPPEAGRTHVFLLIQHLARSTSGFKAHRIDLSKYAGVPVTPYVIASQINSKLGWNYQLKVDQVAQDATHARLLSYDLIPYLRAEGRLCLVFDGLDRDNIEPAAISFIGALAESISSAELPDARLVILGIKGGLDRDVQSSALHERLSAGLPLGDFVEFFYDLGLAVRRPYKPGQIEKLISRLFGTPAPDPVPVALVRERKRSIENAINQRWGDQRVTA